MGALTTPDPGPSRALGPPIDAQTAAAALGEAFRAAANPQRAEAERRYLKSNLEFLGVGVPGVRAALREVLGSRPFRSREPLVALCQALWRSELHEDRMAVVLLLERRGRLLSPADLPFLEQLVRESRTWAYVDSLAAGPIAALAAADPHSGAWLDRWANDGDFWIRRAAMLALLPALKSGAGDWERFTRYADAMLGENEFFVRKAIGWILRETSKKRPAFVAGWLLPRAARASGVTVREAVRYLDPADRDAILAAYNAGRRPGRA